MAKSVDCWPSSVPDYDKGISPYYVRFVMSAALHLQLHLLNICLCGVHDSFVVRPLPRTILQLLFDLRNERLVTGVSDDPENRRTLSVPVREEQVNRF